MVRKWTRREGNQRGGSRLRLGGNGLYSKEGRGHSEDNAMCFGAGQGGGNGLYSGAGRDKVEIEGECLKSRRGKQVLYTPSFRSEPCHYRSS